MDMSRRNFNKGLLVAGGVAAGGGLLAKKAPVIKAALKSTRPLIPEAVAAAKSNPISPQTVDFLRKYGWDKDLLLDYIGNRMGTAGAKEVEKISDSSPVVQKALSEFGDVGPGEVVEKELGSLMEREVYDYGISKPFMENNTLADMLKDRIPEPYYPADFDAAIYEINTFGEPALGYSAQTRQFAEEYMDLLRQKHGVDDLVEFIPKNTDSRLDNFSRDVLEAYRRIHGEKSELQIRAEMKAAEQAKLVKDAKSKPDMLRSKKEREALKSQQGLLGRLGWWNW